MSATLLVLRLSATLILLTDCLNVEAVILVMAELVQFMFPRARLVTCMVMPRLAIPLDEPEFERARLSEVDL